jgi:membrane fusion protein (multidrug efflux system)
VLGAALLAAWIGWALRARVSVYEVTEDARLEVEGGRHVVQSPVAGSVVSSALVLGAEVSKGQVLVRLDVAELEKALAEKLAESKALERELAALEKELEAVRDALGTAQQAKLAAVAEAQAAKEAAVPEAERAARRAAQIAKYEDHPGAFSTAEIDEARTQASARDKALAELKHRVARLGWDHESQLSDRLVALQQLEREATAFRAGADKLAPAIERLKVAIGKRTIVAPDGGVLGGIAELTAGAFVAEGAALCTIVPQGAELKVVAQFQPSAAVGRIAPGQPAQLRVHGFPWAQYGRLDATVTSIGSEAPDGKLRVELSVTRDASAIPLQHGLGTAVDVEVERVSPAALLLRAAGKWIEPGTSESPPAFAEAH